MMGGGAIAFRPYYYRVDRQGHILEDVTKYMSGGVSTWNVDQDTHHAELTVSAFPTGLFTKLVDYLFVKVEFTYADGSTILEPMGHYRVIGIRNRFSNTGAIDDLTCYDLVYELSTSRITIPYTIPAGADPLSYVTSNLTYIGFSSNQFAFPPTARATAQAVNYQPGDSRQLFINDLFGGLGWYYIWMRRDGKFTTGPSASLNQLQPRTTYTAGDLTGQSIPVFPSVTTDPDDSQLCNVATVRNITPGQTSIWYTAKNDDPTSPIAISKVGVIALPPEDNPQITTKAEAQARAELLVSQGSSFLNRATITTHPDPYFGLHDAIGVNITGPDGTVYLNGTWWRRTVSFPLTKDGWNQGQTMEINRIQPFVLSGVGGP